MAQMSEHRGNVEPFLSLEEHDGDLTAKKVSLVSGATIYAVVNTGAAGVQNSIVTVANAMVTVTVIGNVTLSNSQGYIGLVTATPVGLVTTIQAGNATIIHASNITLFPSPNFIGLVTAWHGSNVTLNQSAAFIGLTTVVPDFGSNVTVHTAIYSATGNSTLFVAPASNRFFLTSLHISSLGRSELEIRSGATTLIPFTSLSTTGGYVHDWDNPGLPSRAQADALVVNLNGSATISILASWYARP